MKKSVFQKRKISNGAICRVASQLQNEDYNL